MCKMVAASRFIIPIGFAILLGACATATPFKVSGGQQNNALIKGTAALSFLLPQKNTADIEAVNGKAIGASEASVILPPGSYTFTVHCQASGFFGSTYFGKRDLTFAVEAAHEYQFESDPPLGDSKECDPYVYDSTGARSAYSETIDIPLSVSEKNQWHSLSAGAHAGHTVVDLIPKGQSGNNWQQMIEIESWTKLMFPGTAHDFFQQQAANARKNCPNTRVNVLSESATDVTYEFETGSDCTGTDVRSQFGRFLTGKYGTYHAVFISRIQIPDTDKTKWLAALHSTSIVEKN
jgi:hypothetical protein